MDEDHLVALAVPVVALHRLRRAAERDLDVVVPHQQLPAPDGVAFLLDPGRLHVPVRVRVRNPLLALDRLEVAELFYAAGRDQVVQDRLVPDEALEPHDLFGQERAVVAKLDVAFARDLAAALIGRHGRRITTDCPSIRGRRTGATLRGNSREGVPRPPDDKGRCTMRPSSCVAASQASRSSPVSLSRSRRRSPAEPRPRPSRAVASRPTPSV